MSIKTLILSALSCIFFITTVSAGKYPTIADAKKDIRHTPNLNIEIHLWFFRMIKSSVLL